MYRVFEFLTKLQRFLSVVGCQDGVTLFRQHQSNKVPDHRLIFGKQDHSLVRFHHPSHLGHTQVQNMPPSSTANDLSIGRNNRFPSSAKSALGLQIRIGMQIFSGAERYTRSQTPLKGENAMCDYSLAHYPNRLAVEGEQLVVHRFPSGTVGLASSGQEMSSSSQNPKRSACNCAVCVPPGAQLRLHDIPEHIQTSLGVGAVEEVMFVERSAEAFVHRDAVGFGNGRQVLLQYLHVGQRVDVLSLSS